MTDEPILDLFDALNTGKSENDESAEDQPTQDQSTQNGSEPSTAVGSESAEMETRVETPELSPHIANAVNSSALSPELADETVDLGDSSEGEGLNESARPASLTVSEVNSRVRELLENSFSKLWITGEVTNWTRARSGHCYFTLKDEGAQLRCVMWKNAAARLPIDPEEGMKIRVFGGLTLYEVRGDFQLSVQLLESEDGEGLWKIAFEKLRKQLEAEGLLAPDRKRRLPSFPSCVGVVTSPTGAAIRDILSVLERRAPWTRVVIRGARVQGEGASQEIAQALAALASTGLPDVIIVGRGGGSIEDLWAFNEEPVARAIAACPVPVISAVGHEVDVTISDLVADFRAPTPSAAAEAAVPDRSVLVGYVRDVLPRLSRGLQAVVQLRRRRFDEAIPRLDRGIQRRFEQLEARRRLLEERLGVRVRKLIGARRRDLGTAAAAVDALSPLATMKRGYAVPQDDEGRVLRTIENFPVGGGFHLRVVDGSVECEVRGSEPRNIQHQTDG